MSDGEKKGHFKDRAGYSEETRRQFADVFPECSEKLKNEVERASLKGRVLDEIRIRIEL